MTHPDEPADDRKSSSKRRTSYGSSKSKHTTLSKRKRLIICEDSPEDQLPDSDDKHGSRNETSLDPRNHRPESDDYCWICHKVGQMVICNCCPRVYHPACMLTNQFPETWICPECQDLMVAECVQFQKPVWANITAVDLQNMLCFLINRLSSQSWAEHFREPVDTEQVIGYSDIISFPMDLRTLHESAQSGRYSSVQSFLYDFYWILHNCIVFNGSNSPLTSLARTLDNACRREVALMKACPTCYQRRMRVLQPSLTNYSLSPSYREPLHQSSTNSSSDFITNPAENSMKIIDEPLSNTNETNPLWFSELCNDVHPILWIRLQRYPRWPAKLMAIDDDVLLVLFFGDYDVTLAPSASAQLHSEEHMVPLFTHSGAPSLEPISSPQPSSMTEAFPSPPLISPVHTNSKRVVYKNSTSSLATKSITMDSVNPTTEADYKQAMLELEQYLQFIRIRHPSFILPHTPLEFSRKHVRLYYKVCFHTETIVRVPSHKSVVRSTEMELCYSQSLPTSTTMHINPALHTLNGSPKDSSIKEPLISPSRQTSDFKRGGSGSGFFPPHRPPSMTLIPNEEDVNSSLPRLVHTSHSMGPIRSANELDEIQSLLTNFRSQINTALQHLETKWQNTQIHLNTVDCQSRTLNEPPVLCAIGADKEVQTMHVGGNTVSPPSKSFRDDMKKSRDNPHFTHLQSSMMELEIDRLDRENQRLHLLLAFTRAEMAMEMRYRIGELRHAWNYEVSAILEAASKIWEQDVVRIVDVVKKKQWCAYCGRPAFYYCCWNTCYCNSQCQSKHWAVHITHCVQTRSQLNNAAPAATFNHTSSNSQSNHTNARV